MILPEEELEYLRHSEKRAWLIVYVHDAVLHVLRRPVIFLHSYNPTNDMKHFSVIFDEDGKRMELKLDIKITDYAPHEIEAMVRLAYAKMGVSITSDVGA